LILAADQIDQSPTNESAAFNFFFGSDGDSEILVGKILASDDVSG